MILWIGVWAHKPGFDAFCRKNYQSKFTRFWGKFFTENFICVKKLTLCNSANALLYTTTKCPSLPFRTPSWYDESKESHALPDIAISSSVWKGMPFSVIMLSQCTSQCPSMPFRTPIWYGRTSKGMPFQTLCVVVTILTSWLYCNLNFLSRYHSQSLSWL